MLNRRFRGEADAPGRIVSALSASIQNICRKDSDGHSMAS